MKSFVFLSGKGGTGKSVLVCNIAIELAALEKKVLVFDADFGLANVDILMGCDMPTTLAHVIRDKRPLEDAVKQTKHDVDILSGGSGMEELIDLDPTVKTDLLAQLAKIMETYDYVLFDGPPGLTGHLMTLIQATDETVLVATPDPTCLMDAYAMAKYIWQQEDGRSLGLIVNMVESDKEGATIFKRVSVIVGQFLSKTFVNYGSVKKDKRVADSVRSRTPVVVGWENCGASQDIAFLAEVLSGESEIEEDEEEEATMLDKLKAAFSGESEDEDESEDVVLDDAA